MPKGNPVFTKIYFYLETEQGINKEFMKQVFFKLNSSLGSFLLQYSGDESASVPDQQNNIRDCGLFSIANATDLAFKWDPRTVRDVSTDRRCFPDYIALRYLHWPVKLYWLPTIDLFSERIDKIRGKIH